MKSYSYILIIGSIVGLLASLFLMIDTISLIKDPAAELPCNLNPFISCGNAILSEQGEIFGFPNPLMGLGVFGFLLAGGLVLATGNTVNKKFALILNLATLGAMGFVVWFYYQSLYNLGTLCLYCMTVWLVSWPIFLYTLVWSERQNYFTNSIYKFASKYHLQILIIGYLVGVLGILIKFQDYFFS